MSDGATTPNAAAVDSGAASPTKSGTPAPAVKFTEKEENVLKVAWSCLKSGPPEVDIQKLTELGGFKTQKTAQNTWGAVKKKLMAMTPASATAGEDGAATPSKTPATPKAKATPTPKKRTKKAATEGEEGSEGETASPKKKARTPAKKKSEAKVKEEPEAAEEEGEMEG